MTGVTVGVKVRAPTSEYDFSYTIGDALPVTSEDGTVIFPLRSLELLIKQLNNIYSSDSRMGVLLSLNLRLYLGMDAMPLPNTVDVDRRFIEILSMGLLDPCERVVEKDKKHSATYIEKFNRKPCKAAPFLVADMETIIVKEEYHVPYAVGLMQVNPGSKLPPKGSVMWWYSEDNFLGQSFEDRSRIMLNSFLDHVLTLRK